MNIWRSLNGIIEAELTSADVESAVNASNDMGIPLYQMERKDDFTTRFQIKRTDWEKLNEIIQKRGDKLSIVARRGVFFHVKGAFHRPVIVVGLLIFFLALMFLPTRVLFVRTEGNTSIPSRKIIAAGESYGIYFGASRREVRSERVKNALLAALPELQWAGVNTKGCVAIISVRERTEPNIEQANEYISSIVAERDGVITSCSVTEGNLVCTVGQAVQKGQMLISGYTDCGLCIRATGAEGEIFAQTERELSVTALTEFLAKEADEGNMKNISLLIGKKRINLWKDSGIWDATCDRMYEEYYLTLPGGHQLPIGIAIDHGTSYQLRMHETDMQELKASIADYGKNYLHQHMVAGKILSSSEVVAVSNGTIQMNGEYICTEMIGKVQREQIGEENGENDGTDR